MDKRKDALYFVKREKQPEIVNKQSETEQSQKASSVR
jgi:hypothetical protein